MRSQWFFATIMLALLLVGCAQITPFLPPMATDSCFPQPDSARTVSRGETILGLDQGEVLWSTDSVGAGDVSRAPQVNGRGYTTFHHRVCAC